MATRQTLFKEIIGGGGDLFFLNSSPFAKLLDVCIKSKSLLEARCVHARIVKSKFSSELFINNRLIDAYGKCGSVNTAQKLFDKMSLRNVFTGNAMIGAFTSSGCLDKAENLFHLMPEVDQCSWNLMISSFTQGEMFDESLIYFVKMHEKGEKFNEYSYGSALSACAGLRNSKMGIQIHALLGKSPLIEYVYMGSALIDMYAKCGKVDYAVKIFHEMNERNTVSWNSLITCYEQNGPALGALEVFVNMMNSGFEPDEMTLASVISACATLNKLQEGREIHCRVMKFDKFRNDIVISNALVDMYAKCGKVNEARCIFDRMLFRNVVSNTSMVSCYARLSSVKTARSMFSRMMERNIVSWNALIAGYTQNGDNEEALSLFLLLKRESIWPTHYTFGNLLNACANLADLKLGRQSHAHVLKHGFRFKIGHESDIFVGNALIDMYTKCGAVDEGYHVFKNMLERDTVSWNSLIVGYAQNGYETKALELFEEMLEYKEKPDHVTMIGLLSACAHGGLLEQGRHNFNSMEKSYGLKPLKDHYSCMVDLLSRAGQLEEAKNLIESMPMTPDNVVWGSLLAGCKVHGDIKLGKYVANKLLEIDPSNSGPYVLLSNMYAQLGKWKDVTNIRKVMRQNGVVKQPGCSWIEIQNEMHVFMVKDKRHPQKKEIFLLLETLTKLMKLAHTNAFDIEEEQILLNNHFV